MSQSRNENVMYIKITKMYLPKHLLLNCDRLVHFSNGFCVNYLERLINCVSIKIIIGKY